MLVLTSICSNFTTGICCGHGEGNYRVVYDGVTVKSGGAFYDSETVEFGCEVPTARPTDNPTKRPVEVSKPSSLESGSSGSSGSNSSYRCVSKPLVDAGYQVSEQLCNRFIDCYNKYINTGDDWFCVEGEVCIEATLCGNDSIAAEETAKVEEVDTATTTQTAPKPASNNPRPTPSRPVSASTPGSTSTSSVAVVDSTMSPSTAQPSDRPTDAPITASPSVAPTTMNPTGSPSRIPTLAPTLVSVSLYLEIIYDQCKEIPCVQSSYASHFAQ